MPTRDIQPLTLWGHTGPNPNKVAMVLNLLDIPYTVADVGFNELKEPPYLAVNPNGRVPAIRDPNTNLTLWESGAIIEYLIETYDKENTLSFPQGSPEYFLAKQWLFFQVSGQGPYYGQAIWFQRLHSERVESAVVRYLNEIKRVTRVVEGHLSKQEKGADGPWLVGGKFSYADVSWLMWQHTVQGSFSKENAVGKEQYDPEEFPVMTEWLGRMKEKKAVKDVLENPGTH